jgi:hypothetical protein
MVASQMVSVSPLTRPRTLTITLRARKTAEKVIRERRRLNEAASRQLSEVVRRP